MFRLNKNSCRSIWQQLGNTRDSPNVVPTRKLTLDVRHNFEIFRKSLLCSEVTKSNRARLK